MRVASLISAGMLLATPAHAYVVQQSASGAELHFTAMPQYFYLNSAGSDDIADGSDLEAYRRAFGSWQDVENSDARFTKLDATGRGVSDVFNDNGLAGRDKLNLVVWVETAWPESPAQLAVTYTYYIDASGKIVEDDIIMNGEDYTWTSGDVGVQQDVESIAAHEIGHAFGLAHSIDPEATMFATASTGETKKRSLEQDDIDGIIYLYPPGCCPRHAGHDLLAAVGCSVTTAGARAPAAIAALGAVVAAWFCRRRRPFDSAVRASLRANGAGIIVAVCLLAISAEASVARDQSVAELASASESVVHGRVIWQETSEGPNGSIVTLTQIEVDEVLAGAPSSVVTIVEPGGVAPSGIGLHVSGAPRYELGEDVVVFTEPPRGGYATNFPDAMRTTAMAQGKLSVDRDGRLRRDLSGVARVSADGWVTEDPLDGMTLDALKRVFSRP